MKKIKEFLISNKLILKWTATYFVVLWLILRFLFNFNMFSGYNWWKFSHATFHGFPGLLFCIVVYSAIPIYIASTLIIYRKKTPIIEINTPEKIKNCIEKIKILFAKPEKESAEPSPAPETPQDEEEKKPEFERPDDMPPELYMPYLRAKQNRPIIDSVSSFNKSQQSIKPLVPETNETESFPIPSDFDIDDESSDDTNYDFSTDDIPTFKDLDFDMPISTPEPKRKKSSAEKYFEQHNIEYETYKEFVATEKYVIYDHNDGEFWVMDDEKWFASKKQIDSPIPELISLAKQNDLIPVLYLESQNIMDLPGTTERFESMGVRVVKSLEELN